MESGWLIVGGILALVVIINVGTALSALRGRDQGQADLLERSLRLIRNPWADEDEALSELRQQISDLKELDDEQTPPDPE